MGLAVTSLVAVDARAYSVSTIVTDGCHELLTLSALRSVRADAPAAAPSLAVDAGDAPLVDDLPFNLPDDARELAAVSLLLGVRDNDLKGRGSTDLDAIAEVHGNPSTQDEHCLRDLDDDEPTGTTQAVARCRAFIVARVSAALDHLAPDGTPDPTSRVALPVTLAIRGAVTAELPGFYVNLGQALHALQDSFSHSYRTTDSRAIRASLTWLHLVDDDLDESVTGPPHSSELDRCVGLDDLRLARESVAIEASQALLAAALGPGTRDDRLTQVNVVLDTYASVTPGCTAANAWCDAPERAYASDADGCALGGGRAGGLALGLGALWILAARRRRGPRACALVAVLACLAASPVIRAADEPLASAPAAEPLVASEPRAGAVAVKPLIASEAPEARFVGRPRYGVIVSVGASLNHAATNLSLGGRFRLTARWLIGIDAEWNPWMSLEGEHVRPGAFNAYATLIRRWSMLSDQFDVRTAVHLGTSTVLFDLYGVPEGSTGLYAGVSLLGLEWRASRMMSVIVDPADVVYPLPQLRGAPFGYLQYRFTIGLQWGA